MDDNNEVMPMSETPESDNVVETPVPSTNDMDINIKTKNDPMYDHIIDLNKRVSKLEINFFTLINSFLGKKGGGRKSRKGGRKTRRGKLT